MYIKITIQKLYNIILYKQDFTQQSFLQMMKAQITLSYEPSNFYEVA